MQYRLGCLSRRSVFTSAFFERGSLMALGDMWVFEGIIDALGTHTVSHSSVTYSSFILRDRNGQKKIYNEVWVGPNAGTQIRVGQYARFFFTHYKRCDAVFAVLNEGGLYEDMSYTAQLSTSGRGLQIAFIIFGALFTLVPTIGLGGAGFVFGGIFGVPLILLGAYNLNRISQVPSADRMKAFIAANS